MGWSITLLSPWWLALTAVFPLVVWISAKSLAGLGPVRRWIVIGLRLTVLTLILLALADMQMVWRSDRACTVFVLDQSQSMPQESSEAMLEVVGAAIAGRPNKDDLAGLVVFGKEARIELPPYQYPNVRMLTSGGAIDRQHSDLAAGIKLALGAFPPDVKRRVILITDGNQNRGNALAQAIVARRNDVPIDVVPIEYRYDNEIFVDKVILPADLKVGDTAELKVIIRSSRPATGKLRVKRTAERTDETVYDKPVELQPGPNVIKFRERVERPNFYTYQAEFEPDAGSGDRLARNNRAGTFVNVRGEGKILLVQPRELDTSPLVDKLRLDRLSVKVVTPDAVGTELGELRQFDTTIIINTPAEQLPEKVQEALAANTRELGGGLIMVGGPESFGAGGYTGTPLEKALPVDMEIKGTKVRDKAALVLIMHASEIPEGNFWQKTIAKLAIKRLASTDECGLLYHDLKDAWLFKLQLVGNRMLMDSRIDRMMPGDMPDFAPTMGMAEIELRKSDARTKHIILISDGDPQPPPAKLLQALTNAKITCTTVAVAAHGQTEKTRMQEIAKATGGRYHDATDPRRLPEIYIQETRIISRALIYERDQPWSPTIAYPTEPVAGLPKVLPPIKGFVLTSAKPTAEVAIKSPLPGEIELNPILAHWQYGLGRSAAVTTDAGAQWATAWVESPVYAKLWSQVVRWTMRPAESDNLSISMREVDGVVKVVVNALDKDNRFWDFLQFDGTLIRPDMSSQPILLRQTEPGKYEGEFTTSSAGSHFLQVRYRDSQGKQGFASAGWNVSYPPEFRDLQSNRELLENIASVSDGRVIPSQEFATADFFPRNQAPSQRLQGIWPWLLLSALCVFLFDVGARRIAIDPADIRRFGQRMTAMITRRAAPAPPTPTMQRLHARKAVEEERFKRKVELKVEKPEAPSTQLSADAESSPRGGSVLDELDKPTAPPPPPPAAKPGGIAPAEPIQQPDSYTSRLLKAKKKVWDEKDTPEKPQ